MGGREVSLWSSDARQEGGESCVGKKGKTYIASPARKGVLVDLVLDVGSRVSHVDGRVRVRGRHLCVRPLEGRDEHSVQERGLLVLELGGDVAGRSEVL